MRQFYRQYDLELGLMVHTTPGQGAGWRIVAGICPLIAGPLRRLLNYLIAVELTIVSVEKVLKSYLRWHFLQSKVGPPSFFCAAVTGDA